MELIEKRVCFIGGVWTKVHERVDSALSKLMNERRTLLTQALEQVYDGILYKFNALCEDTAVLDEAEKEREEQLRQKLQKNVVLGREMVEGDLYNLAMQCKNYSATKEKTGLFVP